MTYTVWTYDYDAAPHHDNDLLADTVYSYKEAEALARKRTAETNHNTGYSKVIDNSIAGRMGDCGEVSTFYKVPSTGKVRRYYIRDQYRKFLRYWRSTAAGLHALYNKELGVWEYFESTGPNEIDLRQTGSTINYEH